MFRRVKTGFIGLLTLSLVSALTANSSGALPAAQDPATESIIIIEADGVAPFDGATADPAADTNAGLDGPGLNGIVRNFDAVTYNVELSLNDADDTNLVGTVFLNEHASWGAVPDECLTVANGFAVVPDSEILDSTGDGLFDTLICNVGDHVEGTKVLVKPVAVATGNNKDFIQASVISSSDNNANLSGYAGTQGDGPVETQITATFGINIAKSVSSLLEQAQIPNETTYNPAYHDADAYGLGSEEGASIAWHIALNYNASSELVEDNAGVQSFTIEDTWTGTHSTGNAALEGNNAAGDYDDLVQLLGAVTGDPLDSCDFVTPIPGATVTCTQPNPGEPVIIQIDDVPVNQPQLAKIRMNLFYSFETLIDGTDSETYDTINTATLVGWGGTTALVTSAIGTPDLGTKTSSEDYLVSNTPTGTFSMYKTFDSVSVEKSGQVAAAPGAIIPTSLAISDRRRYDANLGLCDTLDIASFEFAGSASSGQISGISNGSQNIIGSHDGMFDIPHAQFNPVLALYYTGDFGESFDALQHGLTVEYSDVDYSVTGDDHWTATCEDDLSGNGGDWVTDYTTLTGGAASVVRVRMVWDRDFSEIEAMHTPFEKSWAVYSFDLKLKDTVTIGTRLPNTAATYNGNGSWPYGPYGNDNWLGTVDGAGSPWAYHFVHVEDDPTNQLYSFNIFNADRVLVVPASMRITKDNEPITQGPVAAADVAMFKIDPSTSGSAAGPETMTIVDTLPGELAYVSDDCAAVYDAVGLTCTVSVSGQVVTWTIPDYNVGDDMPAFVLETSVNFGSPAGTYINEVVISSSLAVLSDDTHCETGVKPDGTLTPAAVPFTQAEIDECKVKFAAPHSDEAPVLILSEAGLAVSKSDVQVVAEPLDTYVNFLEYANLGGSDLGEGHIIEILPHNADGVLASEYSSERFNSENPGNAYTETVTNDPDGAIDFVGINSLTGETFEYSTDDPTTIDHRPCHPDNWAAGVDETTDALLAAICARGLIDPATDVPTALTPGTGATTWGALPGDAADVTAVRVLTPAFPGSETPRSISLEMNTAYSHDGDLFCNNFGANIDLVTLDIISNDVCVEIVAGSIGDYVWLDLNADGVQDVAEPPIVGVDLKLLVEDQANPGTYIAFQVPDSSGALVDYVVTTDSTGEYLFENLPSGNYRVMVDTATLPSGLVQTFDLNGDLDHMSDVTLFGPANPASGETPTDVDEDDAQDFGYSPPVGFADIDIEKLTNDVDSDVAPGEEIFAGNDVVWTYLVTNTGSVALSDSVVTDDQGVAISCDVNNNGDAADDGTNIIPLLIPGQVMICEGTGIATIGQYANNSTVVGDPVVPNFGDCGCDPTDPATWPTVPSVYVTATDATGAEVPAVDDADPSHYIGVSSDSGAGSGAGDGEGEIASTGSWTKRVAIFGLSIVVLGGLMMLAARRRRTTNAN